MAIGAGVIASMYPQISVADGFDGADFAKWETTSQDSYIETSVTMAGVLLSQIRPAQGRCVNDWYFKGEAWRTKNPEIRETIAAYQNTHPSGVILALLIKECGPLDES